MLTKEADVVVIGYGGWDDAITEAISMSLSDPTPTEVYWCFYDDDRGAAERFLRSTFGATAASNLQSSMLSIATGVDADLFLPEVLSEVYRIGHDKQSRGNRTRKRLRKLVQENEELRAELRRVSELKEAEQVPPEEDSRVRAIRLVGERAASDISALTIAIGPEASTGNSGSARMASNQPTIPTTKRHQSRVRLYIRAGIALLLSGACLYYFVYRRV